METDNFAKANVFKSIELYLKLTSLFQLSSEEVVKVVLGSSGRSYDKVQITSAHGMDLKVIKGDLFKADETYR